MKRLVIVGVYIIATLFLVGHEARSETVKFESGARPPSPLKVRIAKQKGEPIPKGVPGIEVKGFLAKPQGKGQFPAVVILRACGGITTHAYRDWPDYLTGLGYAVLTVDSFGSRGLGKCLNDLELNNMLNDAYGALDYLTTQTDIDGERIAVFGFSNGGDAVNTIGSINYRNSGPVFKAGISFYGSCGFLIGTEEAIHLPLMEIFGDNDPEANGCSGLGKNSRLKIEILPDTYHKFDEKESSHRTNHLGTKMLYSPEATKKAKELSKAFLAEHLDK